MPKLHAHRNKVILTSTIFIYMFIHMSTRLEHDYFIHIPLQKI